MTPAREQLDARKLEIETGAVFGYSAARTKDLLCIGIIAGEHRPSLWMSAPNSPLTPGVVLGRFNGPAEAAAASIILDTMTEDLNRAIRFYQQQRGDQGR
jgi:hypothetical protein